jgi:hypothetical protein
MKQDSVRSNRLMVMLLVAALSLCSAAYQPLLILKHPFASDHVDSLGNTVADSLIRRKAFDVTFYRTGTTGSFGDTILNSLGLKAGGRRLGSW